MSLATKSKPSTESSLTQTVAARVTVQRARAKPPAAQRSSSYALPATPYQLFGLKIQQQDAIRSVVKTLEGRAARLSQRLLVTSTALQADTVGRHSSSAKIVSHRNRASHHANQLLLDEVCAQLRGNQLQLQKLASELDVLLPSLSSYARVPPEIYSVIFYAIQADYLVDAEYVSASRVPWRLSAVCRWWRSIVRALPSLWTVVHFPVRHTSLHDKELNSHIGRQLLYAAPHSITLHLSIQPNAHICDQRFQGDRYRACLQRALDRTTTVVIADSQSFEFICDHCGVFLVSGSPRRTVKYPLLRTAVFIAPRYSVHDLLLPAQFLPPPVRTKLRKLTFNNSTPQFDFADSWKRAEEVEINSPIAVCPLYSIQCVIDACPSLLLLSLRFHSLISFDSGIWSSSTLQSLTLNMARLGRYSTNNDVIRLTALKTLNLVFPDMNFAPRTISDCEMAHTRATLIEGIARHAPQLSALSATGVLMSAIVKILQASVYPTRLMTLRVGGTFVDAGLGEDLRRTTKVPPCVTFCGHVAILSRDKWNIYLASLAQTVTSGWTEAGPAHMALFDPPVGVRILGVPAVS